MATDLRLTVAEDSEILCPPERRVHQRVVKRVIDLSGALTLLCLLSPLLLFVALLIVFADGFPICYLRRVVGSRGEFDAYKFRPMGRDADAVLELNPEVREAFSKN